MSLVQMNERTTDYFNIIKWTNYMDHYFVISSTGKKKCLARLFQHYLALLYVH